MDSITYKSFTTRIEYSHEDECFVGRVGGIQDIVSFHGESEDEVRRAFQEAVDFYLETIDTEWLNAPLTDDNDWEW